MTLRFCGSLEYGTQRSMIISRGRGGSAGKRSTMTDRGGTETGGSFFMIV